MSEKLVSQQGLEEIQDKVNALLQLGKDKGYLAHSELLDYLPDNFINAEKLDELLMVFENQKIEVIEDSEAKERERATLANPEVLQAKIDEVLNTLTYRQREIIKLRYGLDKDGFTYTLAEVGRIFKIPGYRVRSIEARAIRKLRHPARSGLLEGFSDILAEQGPTDPKGNYYLVQTVSGRYSGHPEPNLFDHAPRELSQDAFLCWLLAWACSRWHKANPALHLTAVNFLNKLLELHQVPSPAEIETLDITRQVAGLDILVLVNDGIALLIEDKVNSSEHSDQLCRYLDTIQSTHPERTCAPIYLKLGEQFCLRAVEDAGWKCFLRPQMLQVLAYGKRQGVQSDIFKDFHRRLLQKDFHFWRHRNRRFR